LTWSTADLCGKITDWKVREDMESLFDHYYITMAVRPSSSGRGKKEAYPRWSWKKCNLDIFRAAAIWEFMQLQGRLEASSEEMAREIRMALQSACDAAAPRIRVGYNRKPLYWWMEEVAQARKASIRPRRSWSRARTKNCDQIRIDNLRREYNLVRKELRIKISRAKAAAW